MSNIQTIYSLRNQIRTPILSAEQRRVIEMIRSRAPSPASESSWKKVEWRSGSSSGYKGGNGNYQGQGQGQGHRSSRGPSSAASGSAPSPFGHSHRNHYAHKEPMDTVPLMPAPVEQKDTDSFETVRSYRRRAHVPSRSQEPSAPPQKYVSKFRKATDKVEDTILNKILLGKLNKFSPSNYEDIKEFITHIIDNGETEMIKCFMKLVFEKAASEEVFCPLYARLLSELSARYPVLLEEMANLYKQYMEIFKEVNQSEETYSELCQRNVEKKYRRGYSQFLAELIKNGVIETDVFVLTIQTIVEQVEQNDTDAEHMTVNDEFADCLMRIVKAIRIEDEEKEEVSEYSQRLTPLRLVMKETMAERIQPFSKKDPAKKGVSTKARFTFLDIYEAIQRF